MNYSNPRISVIFKNSQLNLQNLSISFILSKQLLNDPEEQNSGSQQSSKTACMMQPRKCTYAGLSVCQCFVSKKKKKKELQFQLLSSLICNFIANAPPPLFQGLGVCAKLKIPHPSSQWSDDDSTKSAKKSIKLPAVKDSSSREPLLISFLLDLLLKPLKASVSFLLPCLLLTLIICLTLFSLLCSSNIQPITSSTMSRRKAAFCSAFRP